MSTHTINFIHLEVMGIPSESHGMLINTVQIGDKIIKIGREPYLDKYPHISVSLGNIHLLKSYPPEDREAEFESLQLALANLILRIRINEITGIIGTRAALDALIELAEDFDIADLSAHGLERYLIHPELAERLKPPTNN